MSDLDEEIRRGLERLTNPTDNSGSLTFEQLAARRRQRRNRKAALVVVPVVAIFALVVGVLSLDSNDDNTSVATGGDRDASPQPPTSPTPTDSDTTTTRTDSTTTTAPEDEAPELVGDLGVGRRSERFPGGPGGYLQDVRIAAHPAGGFDRVVFEFDGAESPGYSVEYVDEPIAPTSQQPVDISGDAYLQVTMMGSSEVWAPESVETYPGPYERTFDGLVVQELQQVEDFEAQLVWTIGLRSRQPFAVTALEDPARVVVDILASA